MFVEREFDDPLGETEGGVARVFPFLEIDLVDARLLPRIERDQIANHGAPESSDWRRRRRSEPSARGPGKQTWVYRAQQRSACGGAGAQARSDRARDSLRDAASILGQFA